MPFLDGHSSGLRVKMPGLTFSTPEGLQYNKCNCVGYELIKKSERTLYSQSNRSTTKWSHTCHCEDGEWQVYIVFRKAISRGLGEFKHSEVSRKRTSF